MYCKNQCVYSWFTDAKELGVYKANLSLEDWANEIEWRLRFKTPKDNNDLGIEGNEWTTFKSILKLGDKRDTTSSSFASNLRPPMSWPDENDSESRIRMSPDDSPENLARYNTKNIKLTDGYVVPFEVNLSYDDRTLIERFKVILGDYRSGIEGNSSIKGKKPLTEDNADDWNSWCVLECIDFEIYRSHTGCEFDNSELTRIFNENGANLGKNTIVTSIKTADEIFKKLIVGHIRASKSIIQNQ